MSTDTTPATEPAEVRDWPTDPFEKALAAEPRLRAVDRMVRVAAATAPKRRTGKPFCSGCYWSGILKPLVTPLVGWSRGEFREARERPNEPVVFTRADLESLDFGRPSATTAIEGWLRGMEAYDAVTNRWLKILDKADPANGHGLPDINR